jgi:hypothetical protein
VRFPRSRNPARYSLIRRLICAVRIQKHYFVTAKTPTVAKLDREITN